MCDDMHINVKNSSESRYLRATFHLECDQNNKGREVLKSSFEFQLEKQKDH